MKYIRICMVILFVLSLGSYTALRVYNEITSDTEAPVITCKKDSIKVSVKDDMEALLKGVTASDNKDGDITKDVVVENIGPFLSDMSREITYAVCDDANNTARKTRTLTYKDYEPPHFAISQQLRFPAGEKLDILQYLSAEDVLDGNITGQIKDTYGYLYSSPSVGKYKLGYQVANSAGDVANIDLVVDIYEPEDENCTPTVNLDDYVVYLKKGKSFNPYQYIKDISIGNRTFSIQTSSEEVSAEEGTRVKGMFGDLANKSAEDKIIENVYYNDIYVDNQVDRKKAGTYTVTYTVVTEDGYTGSTGLSVIVYE
ncbi:MAG: hypothetical protein Q4F21_00810 [Lachnospiraceae bacterium]|nr:hypothetical protein [Lachnospiraceae bacterium]